MPASRCWTASAAWSGWGRGCTRPAGSPRSPWNAPSPPSPSAPTAPAAGPTTPPARSGCAPSPPKPAARPRTAPSSSPTARRQTGLPLEIINPREEAELAVESCASLICQASRRALLFDIGGGSTEIAWVRVSGAGAAPDLIGYLSLPIGVVTLSERCAEACYRRTGYASVVRDVMAMLAPFEAVHQIGQEIRQGGVLMVGTSGTVTTLAGVSLKLERYRRGLVDGICLKPWPGRRGAGPDPPARPRRAGAPPLHRRRPRRLRAARLRHLLRHPRAVAGGRPDRRRPRPARGHADAADARRQPGAATADATR